MENNKTIAIAEFSAWHNATDVQKEIAEVFELAICSNAAKNWSESKKLDALHLKAQLCALLGVLLE